MHIILFVELFSLAQSHQHCHEDGQNGGKSRTWHSNFRFYAQRALKILRLAAELMDDIVYTGEVATLTTTIAALTQCCAEPGRAANQVKVVYRLPAA